MCGEHTLLSLSYLGCAFLHCTLQQYQLQQVFCRKKDSAGPKCFPLWILTSRMLPERPPPGLQLLCLVITQILLSSFFYIHFISAVCLLPSGNTASYLKNIYRLIYDIPTAHHCNCTAIAPFHVREARRRQYYTWQHEILGKVKCLNINVSVQCEWTTVLFKQQKYKRTCSAH